MRAYEPRSAAAASASAGSRGPRRNKALLPSCGTLVDILHRDIDVHTAAAAYNGKPGAVADADALERQSQVRHRADRLAVYADDDVADTALSVDAPEPRALGAALRANGLDDHALEAEAGGDFFRQGHDPDSGQPGAAIADQFGHD